MAHKPYEEKLALIAHLELEISKLEKQQGGKYGNLFPKILKLTRKLQKVRDSL